MSSTARQSQTTPEPEGRRPVALGQTLAVVTMVALAIACLVLRALAPPSFSPKTPAWLLPYERPAVLWGGMGLLLLTVRTALWLRYRPAPASTTEEAPWLTVIIPAYNEGAMVEKSIESVAAARYPRNRLEIFVIDDGSRDDTWLYIERAAGRHRGLVTSRRFEKNRGKRAALAEGFRSGRGEVFITIDSDSVIEAGTLLAMTGPFRDGRVGAVAGRVEVYNRWSGWLPPMLHVRYLLSFDFLRAVQSTFRTVYCCPGALAAYRAAGVHRVLEAWERQRFLGAPCTYGEDRALTNLLMAEGYDSVYQSTAVVHTVAPATYAGLCRMYLRWDRSWVREELRFLRRVLWRRPLRYRAMAAIDVLLNNLRYPVGYAVLGLLVVLSLYDPITLVRVLLAIGLLSLAYTLFYLRSERSWCFLFGVAYAYFSFFTIFWVFPWAVLTVRSRSWMTR